jgi:hypothetical protein
MAKSRAEIVRKRVEADLLAEGRRSEDQKDFLAASVYYRKAHMLRENVADHKTRSPASVCMKNLVENEEAQRNLSNFTRIFLHAAAIFADGPPIENIRTYERGSGSESWSMLLLILAHEYPYIFAVEELESDIQANNIPEEFRKTIDNCQKQFVREAYGLEPDTVKGGVRACREWRRREIETGQMMPPLKKGEDVARDAILDIISDHRGGNSAKEKVISPHLQGRIINSLDHGLRNALNRQGCDIKYGSEEHIVNALKQLDAVYEKLAANKSSYFIRSDGNRNLMSGTESAHLKVLKEVYLSFLEKAKRLQLSKDAYNAIDSAVKNSALLRVQRARFFKTSVSASKLQADELVRHLTIKDSLSDEPRRGSSSAKR